MGLIRRFLARRSSPSIWAFLPGITAYLKYRALFALLTLVAPFAVETFADTPWGSDPEELLPPFALFGSVPLLLYLLLVRSRLASVVTGLLLAGSSTFSAVRTTDQPANDSGFSLLPLLVLGIVFVLAAYFAQRMFVRRRW